MTTLAVGVAAVLGLVVGSFLNVVVHRVPRGESVVRPRSRCPACAAPVAPRDNVPVLSFLLLRGRCRGCRSAISPRYPLVEAGTAVLFGATAARFGATAVLPAFLYLAAIALALALIDIDVKRLPNAIVLPSYPVAAVLLGLAAAARADAAPLLRAAEGMAACYAGYYLLAWAYPAGMGFGDVKLAGVLGLYLGYLGWAAVAVGIFAGFLYGGLVALAVLLVGRAGRKSTLPFGPFMLAGAFTAVFAAAPIAHAYLSSAGV